MELKFRAWDVFNGSMIDWFEPIMTNKVLPLCMPNDHYKDATGSREYFLMQFAGLADNNGKDYYIGDIGQFDNGDKFYLAMENWLEVWAQWIGNPECEDQARDLYRISNSKIIGNIHQNPELMESN